MSMSKEDDPADNYLKLTSTSNDQKKKINKKQAKRMARKHVSNDSSEQLAQNMDQITLQTASTDCTKSDDDNVITNNNDKKQTDKCSVAVHSSVNRRHVSESHADIDPNAKGEFKLKVIAENSSFSFVDTRQLEQFVSIV
jgi:hypothetical protein